MDRLVREAQELERHEMSDAEKALALLEKREGEIEQAVHNFLRCCGWTYTFELSGVWLWKKVFPERGTLYVNASTARLIEELGVEEGADALAE